MVQATEWSETQLSLLLLLLFYDAGLIVLRVSVPCGCYTSATPFLFLYYSLRVVADSIVS